MRLGVGRRERGAGCRRPAIADSRSASNDITPVGICLSGHGSCIDQRSTANVFISAPGRPTARGGDGREPPPAGGRWKMALIITPRPAGVG